MELKPLNLSCIPTYLDNMTVFVEGQDWLEFHIEQKLLQRIIVIKSKLQFQFLYVINKSTYIPVDKIDYVSIFAH